MKHTTLPHIAELLLSAALAIPVAGAAAKEVGIKLKKGKGK